MSNESIINQALLLQTMAFERDPSASTQATQAVVKLVTEVIKQYSYRCEGEKK